MSSFTHYWRHDTVEYHEELVTTGRLTADLDHSASASFVRAGLDPDDFLYVISFTKGALYLVARMRVKEIVDQKKADRMFKYQVWYAQDHAIGVPGESTDMFFDLVVPQRTVDRIRFISGGHPVRPARNRAGKVDPQTFRGVRELSDATAALFDELLDRRA